MHLYCMLLLLCLKSHTDLIQFQVAADNAKDKDVQGNSFLPFFTVIFFLLLPPAQLRT